MSTPNNPLAERDTNQQSPKKSAMEAFKHHAQTPENENMPREMDTTKRPNEEYKSTLERRVAENSNDKYVSPSDSILSPASQKLSSFKQRQIGKRGGANPIARSLFSNPAKSGEIEDAGKR